MYLPSEVRASEAPQQLENTKRDNVLLEDKNTSEGLYESHKTNIRKVLDRYSVLAHNTLFGDIEELVNDLAELK